MKKEIKIGRTKHTFELVVHWDYIFCSLKKHKWKILFILVALCLFSKVAVDRMTIMASEMETTTVPVVLEPMKVVDEIPEPVVVEEPEPEPVETSPYTKWANVTLYNEVSGYAYYTGYHVYGTDYVLNCDGYFCTSDGYLAIVVNEVYASEYPRGSKGELTIDGVTYPVMIVDYRAIEHSDKIFEVGLIGKSTNGTLPATLHY